MPSPDQDEVTKTTRKVGRVMDAYRPSALVVAAWIGAAAGLACGGCGAGSSESADAGPSDGAPSSSGRLDAGNDTGGNSGVRDASVPSNDAAGPDSGGLPDDGGRPAFDGGAAGDSTVSGDSGRPTDAGASGDAGRPPVGDAGDSGSGRPSDGGAPDTGGGGSVDGGVGCGGSVLGAGPVAGNTTHRDIGVHDPSMIWDGHRYYLFATNTLAYRSSADLQTWSNAGNYLPSVPAWVSTATGATGLWAPDISYFNGSFHVYYAGSTFGSRNSVIGLSTTTTLQSPSWVDHGLVVQSKTTDNFNAIDPNVSFDQSCAPWLSFGSFSSGIKMRKLDPQTGMLATDDTTLYSLAGRPDNGGAIEASSIVAHNGFYYLFVSFDACCKGVDSTYSTHVGRATTMTGPYADKTGKNMLQGGGDLVVATSGRYIGPGGGTAWKNGDTYLYAYHYYDGQDNGASKLLVRPIVFDAGDWATLGEPLFP